MRLRTKHYVGIALLFRIIAARTNLSTGHPDELYQTVEFANSIAFGFQSFTNEYLLHMRNLTWPAMLAGAMKLGQLLTGTVAGRMYALKLLTGLLDLGVLWGLWRMVAVQKDWTWRWQTAAWCLFVFPWFLVGESVRPSQEHLSAIAFWVALGLLREYQPVKRDALLAGIFLGLSAAFRYPSGLLGAGVLLALLLRWFWQRALERDYPPFWLASVGTLLGFGIGGLADWAVYGRPFESLWMYLQYNVFTGISARQFGAQSASVYFDYFTGPFGGILVPFGLSALLLVPAGLARGLHQLEPWACAMALYLFGHALTPHKEPRFMAPILLLTLWAWLQGAWFAREQLWKRCDLKTRTRVARVAVAAVLILFIGNGGLTLRSLWGETWRAASNYLAVSALLGRANTCAVISVRRPVGHQLPWTDATKAPEPALGFFPTPPHQPSSRVLNEKPLVWVERAPRCAPGDQILLQPNKPEDFWTTKARCELLDVGALAWLPREWALKNQLVSAPWYSCPSTVLTHFGRDEVRQVLARSMNPIEKLPAYEISAQDFLTTTGAERPPHQDGTFGDL